MRVDAQGPAQHARSAEQPTLARAAREFESLLTQRLVSQLRAQPDGEEGPGGGMMDLMVNQALAGHLSKGRGLGIAGVLYKSWTGETLPAGAVRLAGNSAGVPAMGAPEGAAPDSAPFAPYTPDGGADDGVTPLRLMMPPTGLEGASADLGLRQAPAKETSDYSLNGPPCGPEHSAGVPQSPFGSANAAVRGVDDGHPTIDNAGPDTGRYSAQAGGGSTQRGRALEQYRRGELHQPGARTSA